MPILHTGAFGFAVQVVAVHLHGKQFGAGKNIVILDAHAQAVGGFQRILDLFAVLDWMMRLPDMLEQGKLKGEAAVLERLLTRRFGPLSDTTRSRLTNATAEQLELWTDRILEAPTLAVVLMQN